MSQSINNYLKVEAQFKQITHLKNLAALIHWDAEVNLPIGSAPSRHQEIGTITEIIHQLQTADSLEPLLEAANNEYHSLDLWQKANFTIIKKAYAHAKCINSKLQVAYSIATSECVFNWKMAREKNDFKALIPSLNHVFDLARQIANAKADHFGKDPYDMMIDLYDPDRTTTEIQSVYDVLKTELPKLLNQVITKQQSETIIPILEKIDTQTQKAIGLHIIEKMGFDLKKGRLDESAHPFCTGSNDDVRLTTRYNANDFMTGLSAIIHETGHGLYQQNLPVLYRNQPVGQAQGMAFHESQSLIMECQAALSLEFMQYLAKILQEKFELYGPAYSPQNLYKLVTRVKPSLIRVDADEVTYPLHVILRFEIEKAIIKENLKAEDLPALWNTKMKQYLGITSPTDTDGCMQDIHWPSGAFGYFPAYTNGAIIGSMLMRAAQAKYPTLKEKLSQGDFTALNTYLNQNLRCWGHMKNSPDLLYMATGEQAINPNVFVDYLQKKYLCD
jgi:carboxypeptidase Taq